MYFCQDVELLAWEPGIFLETAFGHQAMIREAAGTLTGTALVMGSAVLGDVGAGMVAAVELGDGSLTQLVEIVAVADAAHATVSALRGRSSEKAIAPLAGGSVRVTVVSFRPQIAAVGDGLLALVGVTGDRDVDGAPACGDLCGFKAAAIFGTLAAIYRTLVETSSATNVTFSKRSFYEGLAQAARQTLSATVDRDGDGVPETRVYGGVGRLERV